MKCIDLFVCIMNKELQITIESLNTQYQHCQLKYITLCIRNCEFVDMLDMVQQHYKI